jgi:hypothetical protein
MFINVDAHELFVYKLRIFNFDHQAYVKKTSRVSVQIETKFRAGLSYHFAVDKLHSVLQ